MVCASWPQLADVPLRIVTEERPGHSFARQAGVKSASSELIVFCDDDNWLDPSYLQNAFLIMSGDKSIGALGGWSKAAFDDDAIVPEWFARAKDGYAVGAQANKSGDVSERGYLWGAGLVLRKSLYLIITHPSFPLFLTGRIGQKLTAGDDSELCLRLTIIGFKLRYDEELFFHHYIPSSRLTTQYRESLFQGFEESGRVFEKYFFFLKHYINHKNRFLCHLKWNIKYWLMLARAVKRTGSSSQDRMLSLYTHYQFRGLDVELRRLVQLSKYAKSELR